MCHPAQIPGGSYLYAICIDDMYMNRETRFYKEIVPTLRSERFGLKVATINQLESTHNVIPVYLRSCNGKLEFVKEIDFASTLCARDYKGLCKQGLNCVIEKQINNK